MTREDTILCLKGIKNYGRDTFTSKSQGDWQESLDMAIEALEKELEKEYLFESLCDDLKKAQAEIERLEQVNAILKADKVDMLDKIRAEIKQLPTSTCTETCRINIDADDFKENVLVIIDKYKAESEVYDG